jgi:hypothetical protein
VGESSINRPFFATEPYLDFVHFVMPAQAGGITKWTKSAPFFDVITR